ncbi:MAG: quinolinate synthase NadA [Armatimonadota bacterium]|nr:quinolinate synthase NadA [bacterium]
MSISEITEKIQALKAERNAVILAHNYQLGEVQDIADFAGDSLELSRKAAETDAAVIVFCGVHFMAETAKILSPEKTVLIPDPHAGCPMADMINAEQLREFKSQHPGLPVVAYVNTSAEVKAESDICCTSANAVRIVESLDADTILFVPDKSLGSYVASKTNKKVITYCGFCPTHHRILSQDVVRAKRAHPEAIVIAHPECTPDVVALADVVESTSGMIRFVKSSDAREFIVCTERGILHRLKLDSPDKQFYNPSPLNICPNMKKITLEKVLWSLQDMQYEITLPQDMIEKARAAIEGMIAV